MFSCYKTKLGNEVILALSPLEDESNLGAVEHKKLLDFVLPVFNKDMSNVVALIGDIVSTNKSLAVLCGCGFVGCASHRFNLAVKDVLNVHADLIDVVHKIMAKLRHLIPSAKLRSVDSLQAAAEHVVVHVVHETQSVYSEAVY